MDQYLNPLFNQAFGEDYIRELLFRLNDFSSVIGLYQTSPGARKLLGCPNGTPNPHNDLFVAEAIDCGLTPDQLQILDYLNVKFQLQVMPPLTFAKLTRAYNRSGYSPECSKYQSVHDCMLSMARLGLSEELMTQLKINKDRYEQLKPQLRAVNLKIADYDWYEHVLDDLINGSYKHGHLRLAEDLIELSDLDTETGDIAEYAAHIRQMLLPYKLRRSREIRDQHYRELFAADVTDAQKKLIWDTKYNLVAVEEFLNTLENEQDPVVIAAKLKLGLPLNTENLRSNRLHLRILTVFAAQGGDINALLQQTQRGAPRASYGVILALKRGYFQSANMIRPSFKRITMGFKAGRKLMAAIDKFPLVQVRELNVGLAKSGNDKPDTDARLLTLAVQADAVNLYFQLRDVVTLRWDMFQPISETISTSVRAIPMWNDIFQNALGHSKIVQVFRKSLWLSSNYKLLVDIWLTYGRSQFEDSLIYLQGNFGMQAQSDDIGLWYAAVEKRALGLMAYLFGYELLGTMGAYSLRPLTTSGIVGLSNFFLSVRFKDNSQLHAVKQTLEYAPPDVIEVFLLLRDTIQ